MPNLIDWSTVSGPAYSAINGALRYRLYRRGKKNCPPRPDGCGRRDYGACKRADCTFCDKGDFFRCPIKEAPCSQCAPGRDCFSTIVAVTNSAIKKLTSDDITPLAQSRKILCALYNTLCPVHANCGHLYNVTVTWCFDLTSLFQGFFIEV